MFVLIQDRFQSTRTFVISFESEKTDGSYRCECKYGLNPMTYPVCNDYNECSLKAHNCDTHATCVNSVPGFFCVCNPGFRDVSEDYGYYNKDGSVENGRVCEDRKSTPTVVAIGDKDMGISEIGTMSDRDDSCRDVNCPLHASCRSIDESFTCECQAGYEQRNGICGNINECRLGQHNCASQAACFDTEGIFECFCIEGFIGNGTFCNDEDECAGDNICSRNAQCTNTVGSYQCKCQNGFSGNGKQCFSDIPCMTAESCDTNAECVNSYCVCMKGFYGNGTTCHDLNECHGDHKCNQYQFCVNDVGSYYCACKNGYLSVGDGYCEQVNECDLGYHS